MNLAGPASVKDGEECITAASSRTALDQMDEELKTGRYLCACRKISMFLVRIRM